MAEMLFTVIFMGEIAEGRSADEVYPKLVSTGKVSRHQLVGASASRPLVMKDLSREKALNLVQVFESSGASCQVEVQPKASGGGPPQRPAQGPPKRPAERPHSQTREDPSWAPPSPETDRTPMTDQTITCAKCGLMQSRGVECVKCGVLFDKIETVTELADSPDLIAGAIVKRYRPLFRGTRVFLTPAIPSQEALKILRPYLAFDSRWEDKEEFVINSDEELIAFVLSDRGPERLQWNLLLTNLKVMVFRWTDGPMCAGFDLWTLQNINLIGEKKNILKIDDTELELPAVSAEDQQSRELFVKMVSEVSRALKQSERAARLKAMREWQANPHRNRMEPAPLPPPRWGGKGQQGRVTLENLDLREIQQAPPSQETPEEDPNKGNLLSSVKGLFQKK